MYAKYVKSNVTRYLIAVDEELANTAAAPNESTQPSHARSTSSIAYDPSKLDKVMDDLKRYEENFSRNLKVMLDTLNYLAATETVVFLSLCARLSTASEGGEGSDANGGFG